jgi:hypothetical protein
MGGARCDSGGREAPQGRVEGPISGLEPASTNVGEAFAKTGYLKAL